MAKKLASRRTRASHNQSSSDAVQAAAAALQQARDAVQQAEQVYERSRPGAAGRAAQVRALTIGDTLDGTLEFVRRHPAAGMIAAGVVGFLLGRGIRR